MIRQKRGWLTGWRSTSPLIFPKLGVASNALSRVFSSAIPTRLRTNFLKILAAIHWKSEFQVPSIFIEPNKRRETRTYEPANVEGYVREIRSFENTCLGGKSDSSARYFVFIVRKTLRFMRAYPALFEAILFLSFSSKLATRRPFTHERSNL